MRVVIAAYLLLALLAAAIMAGAQSQGMPPRLVNGRWRPTGL
jgi:hypothetical protein